MSARAYSPEADAYDEDEADPNSRRLVFWLEMENNVLRDRVEEASLCVDALVRLLEHLIQDPTNQHLDWAREVAPCVPCDPRLEALFARVEESSQLLSEQHKRRLKKTEWSRHYGGKDDPADPTSTDYRRVPLKRLDEKQVLVPTEEEVHHYPGVLMLEIRGLPKMLIDKELNVGIHDTNQVYAMKAVEANDGSARVMLGGKMVRVQDKKIKDPRGTNDPATWCNRITIRQGDLVVCKTEMLNPAEFPARGGNPLSVPLFGKMKDKDGNLIVVRQGEMYLTGEAYKFAPKDARKQYP
jgi:hypothetical protein